MNKSFIPSWTTPVEATRLKYRVHRFEVKMSQDQERLEEFLNGLEGELVTIIPNVRPHFTMGGMGAKVSFLFIVEKLG
jgi:hypothetical protein